jgi:ferredoxin-NADP reductase
MACMNICDACMKSTKTHEQKIMFHYNFKNSNQCLFTMEHNTEKDVLLKSQSSSLRSTLTPLTHHPSKIYRAKPILRFESKLLKVTDLTSVDKEFEFSVPPEFTFTPGQFVTILFEKDGKPLRRPYSIASAPYETAQTQTVKLIIKKVEGGPGTTMLWNLAVGDTIRMMGPLGVFVLKEDFLDGPLLFIATGTGIAPFRSMALHLRHIGYTHKIAILAGYRYAQNELCQELKSLSTKDFTCDYHLAISKPHESTPPISTNILRPMRVSDPELLKIANNYKHIFLCGLYDMIKDVGTQLTKQGIDRTKIHFERYD